MLRTPDGQEHPWRIDFEAAFEMEEALESTPMVIGMSLATGMIGLTQAAIMCRVGMEAERRHRRGDGHPVTVAKAQRIVFEMGTTLFCETVAEPYANAYKLTGSGDGAGDSESDGEGQAADPTTAAVGGSS